MQIGGRVYTYDQLLKKYGTAQAILKAAGRTGKLENAFGIWAISGNAASRASKD